MSFANDSFDNFGGGFTENTDQVQVVTKRLAKPISVGMLNWCKNFSSMPEKNNDFASQSFNEMSLAPSVIKYEDMEINNVLFSGFISDLSIQPGFNVYRIDDSSGSYDVRYYKQNDTGIIGGDQEDEFLDHEEETNKEDEIDNKFRKKDLVRVSGATKLSNNNVNLSYVRMQKVMNYNAHIDMLLEACQQFAISKSLLNEYGDLPNGSSAQSGSSKSQKNLFLDTTLSIADRIVEFLTVAKHQYSDGSGVPRREIEEKLNLDSEAVLTALDDLINVGTVHEEDGNFILM
ncbi:hypothetical protein AWRI3578_g2435 [Hanseniaspora opuntiae]|uniref:Replication factor A protein 2 n=1 Tax=Hanseniaspora opuntiae TaxID=211096 RepID=A0A1E5RFX4_9ASCO|nr:hypothetical protein AWRI3578_g2435 [Hanseniaspora opuntiae]